jgi:hypothetical protein
MWSKWPHAATQAEVKSQIDATIAMLQSYPSPQPRLRVQALLEELIPVNTLLSTGNDRESSNIEEEHSGPNDLSNKAISGVHRQMFDCDFGNLDALFGRGFFDTDFENGDSTAFDI